MTTFSGLEGYEGRNWVHPSCCLGRGEFYQLRWLFYGALELAAGGVDVAAAGAADVGGNAGGHDAFLEGGDSGLGGLVEGHVGAGVPDDEVDLAAHAADQGDGVVGVME